MKFLTVLALCVILFLAGVSAQLDAPPPITTNPTECLPADTQVILLLPNDNLLIFPADGQRSAHLLKVSGSSGDLEAIDFRSSNGLIYGINNHKEIVKIDLSTGNATVATNLTDAENFKNSKDILINFNPVNDRLRLITRGKHNFHVDVDILNGTEALTNDTSLQFATIEPSNNGSDHSNSRSNRRPNIVDIAYTGTTGSQNTTLYAIIMSRRGGRLRLATIDPPNNGTVHPLFHIDLPGKRSSGGFHFDIFDSSNDTQSCQLAVLSQDNKFLSLDLQTGNTTRILAGISKWLDNVFDGTLHIVDFTIAELPSSVTPAARRFLF